MRCTIVHAVIPLVLATCLLPGCARRAKVHPVEGRVLLGGQPIKNAKVAFHPLNGTLGATILPVGSTGSDGTYRLTTFEVGDGAPEGEYAVTVVWPDDSLTIDECADPVVHDRLERRYADPAKTRLRAVIRAGRNEVVLKASLGTRWSLPKMRDVERE